MFGGVAVTRVWEVKTQWYIQYYAAHCLKNVVQKIKLDTRSATGHYGGKEN